MADGSFRTDDASAPAGSGRVQAGHETLSAEELRRFRATPGRSIAQVATTLLAYIATLAAMYAALHVSVWLAMALVPPAAGLVVRLFVILHDCSHGAYFPSQRANELVGRLCGLATFTPYANWRRHHALHHAAWNNLDRRDGGVDIYVLCLTLKEYLALSPLKRWLYRLQQHPVVTQFLIPPFVFMVLFRLPFDTPKSWQRERRSVLLTNLSLVALFGILVACFGWQAVLIVHLPIMITASVIGIWMFAVQHRFEETEWVRHEEWSAARAALNGTSYFKLPAILQWFTGNIGFHHIHHLAPRVPNYYLQACHEILKTRQRICTLTVRDALRAPHFVLWDETQGRMVPFPA
jgi:acyl-lipid omega-6 desaturase (Delta-12 desaturase)